MISLLNPFLDSYSKEDNLNPLQKLRLYRMERDSRWWIVMQETPGTYDCELEEARYVYTVFKPLIRVWLSVKRLRTERWCSRLGIIPDGEEKCLPTGSSWCHSFQGGDSK